MPSAKKNLFLYLGDYNLASQKGMALGSVRHAADFKAEDIMQKSQGILTFQTG